ncbi:Uu.00g114560.m01.CDS01 [Anthostomella pinea]|uniref:Ribosome quality control complex subunit 2 n=1 Tax=Anthostomella pinea TaxID=933095 RepID=A0AAI8VFR1_9PEZI|nr:Uu.00g114560.m01.CDS01 [Anthostomella pinea]
MRPGFPGFTANEPHNVPQNHITIQRSSRFRSWNLLLESGMRALLALKLDIGVIAHELSKSVVSLRLSNIYDLSSKILLLKFAKPEVKKQLLIDSGFRCHLTDFVRTTAAAPSVFVQKLRKALKTRRVTAISQIGTDRIIELKFSDGQYRLYLEFFAGGNVILTDSELKILTLLRHVPEGEGQEPQRPGLTYSLDNRQNYGGVPDLTKDRLRAALQTTVDRNATSVVAGKKIKKKPGDELRRGLATTITELPPILVDHAMRVTGFDSKVQPAAVLENEALLDQLLRSLEEARKIVEDVTSSDTCKGYILAKTRPGSENVQAEPSEGEQQPRKGLLYEDFHPFLPRQFEEDSAYTVLTFDNFDKMVDEFFSSLEGQKLESRLTEREAAAKRKLDAAKADQAKRIEGLQAAQQLNIRKANAIEANIERVEEAMDAVNGLIHQGMDWEDIGKLIDRERRRNNPVASIIIPPLKLHENTITVLLGEAEADEDEDDEDAYETDSSMSTDSGFASSEASRGKSRETRLAVDINLGISPYSNAEEYYDERKTALVKEQKTLQQSETALKSAEQKITAELKKGLKQEKPVLHPVRRQLWFEKFIWFISSDGYLVLGGKDAHQNEMLYRRYLKKGDIYVHADLHGAASVVIKNSPSTPDAPIPPSTLSQAGNLSVCSSSAWDSKAAMSAWWVTADQVSKSAPAGEFLPTGSFMIRGKKNFLPAAQLVLGFALMFKISEESKAKHVKHRLYDGPSGTEPAPEASTSAAHAHQEPEDQERNDMDDARSDSGDSAIDVQEDGEPRANPLQSSDHDDEEDAERDAPDEPAPTEQMRDLAVSEEPPASDTSKMEHDSGLEDDEDDAQDTAGNADTAPATTSDNQASAASAKQASQPKKQQPKRGQRGKAKKIAAKYKHQDEEDRAAIEELIGAAAGKQKAEAEAKANAERQAQVEATQARRRAQHQRQQREIAEHEEVRKLMLDEGMETLDPDEVASLTPLDSIVGTPLPGDEILEVIAVCAPYSAVGRCKYKVKLQPGGQKKGKAVKEMLESWKAVSAKKGVVDDQSLDKEKMWPREVELIKAVKPEDIINVVPVKSLKVMGSRVASGGGAAGKGKGGARGKKKK